MRIKLYHYVHCPFCVRIRMTLGFLGLSYDSIVLSYDDEKTPVNLTGTKMLPIVEIDGKVMNESLDIMTYLDNNSDKSGVLKSKEFFEGHQESLESYRKFQDLLSLLDQLGTNIHNMAMPYWIYTPEFNEKSRLYFQQKKEAKRGPFKNLVHARENFEKKLNEDLLLLEAKLDPFYLSPEFTVLDILLASHLWGMYIVPEFQFSSKIHQYLQQIKKICRFQYHEDFWT